MTNVGQICETTISGNGLQSDVIHMKKRSVKSLQTIMERQVKNTNKYPVIIMMPERIVRGDVPPPHFSVDPPSHYSLS